MRDARGGPKRFRAAGGVERRARVSDELLCERDSLGGRRGWLSQTPSQQAKFICRRPNGAAGERHGGC
jgi:hypothetical protein